MENVPDPVEPARDLTGRQGQTSQVTKQEFSKLTDQERWIFYLVWFKTRKLYPQHAQHPMLQGLGLDHAVNLGRYRSVLEDRYNAYIDCLRVNDPVAVEIRGKIAVGLMRWALRIGQTEATP